jgi:hypothetical protein
VDDCVELDEDWTEENVNEEEEDESEVDEKLVVSREVVRLWEELLVDPAVDVAFCWFPNAKYPTDIAPTIIMITTSTARPLEMACVLLTPSSAIPSRIFPKFKPWRYSDIGIWL